MRHRTPDRLDNAIEAVIDARNHAPPPQIQRDMLFKLTLRLHEEGLVHHAPGAESNKPGQPMDGIHQAGCQPAHEQIIL